MARVVWSSVSLAVALTLSFAASGLAAGNGSRLPQSVSVVDTGANPSWAQLTVAQHETLKPLAAQWNMLDPMSKDKWLNLASRYPSLPHKDQVRMQDRMTQWAKLPPKARGEARLRFMQTRQLPAQEREEKWAAYQALSADERKSLARQARRKQHPIFLADNIVGPREESQVLSNRTPSAKLQQKKNNVVPNTLSTAPGPTTAAPTLLKASRGATTSLINNRPSPPLHQHTGLPKIAASKGFVDPNTLLPKKGPQGAAMSPVPESAPSRPAIRRH
ncbi:MAG: DUF3106 domain-containing protein [Burkholderiales bacterium]|nr:DUF3106 domain-containing protein [Burkholderiales bacterium]MDE2431333.1 DUF3106 domain-containing protein [Burkholderiales bacterium]